MKENVKKSDKKNIKEKVAITIFMNALPTLIQRYEESEERNTMDFCAYCKALCGMAEIKEITERGENNTNECSSYGNDNADN